MACFLVSTAEAVVVKIAEKVVAKKELEASGKNEGDAEIKAVIPMSVKLKWLSRMLFGGSILLLFEHIWHGEIVLWFPFLTAMSDSGDVVEMLKEMGTVGVCMAVLITVIWAVMCKVAEAIVKRPVSDTEGQQDA